MVYMALGSNVMPLVFALFTGLFVNNSLFLQPDRARMGDRMQQQAYNLSECFHSIDLNGHLV